LEKNNNNPSKTLIVSYFIQSFIYSLVMWIKWWFRIVKNISLVQQKQIQMPATTLFKLPPSCLTFNSQMHNKVHSSKELCR